MWRTGATRLLILLEVDGDRQEAACLCQRKLFSRLCEASVVNFQLQNPCDTDDEEGVSMSMLGESGVGASERARAGRGGQVRAVNEEDTRGRMVKCRAESVFAWGCANKLVTCRDCA